MTSCEGAQLWVRELSAHWPVQRAQVFSEATITVGEDVTSVSEEATMLSQPIDMRKHE